MDILYSGLSLNDPLIFTYNNYYCINLYYLYNKYIINEYVTYNTLHKDNELLHLVHYYRFNTTYNILFETFRKLEYITLNFNRILHIYTSIFGIFNAKNKIIIVGGLYDFIDNVYTPNYVSINNKLIIRPGVVELRACSMDNISIINESISILAHHINDESYIDNERGKQVNNWLATTHNRKNYDSIIVSLMTNAGFYCSSNSNEALEQFLFFKNGYINAIENADYLMHWPFLNCFALNILNKKKNIKNVEYIDITSDANLVQLFDNKHILFLTPFKKLVDMQYNSENLYKLRQTNNLTNIKLDTIEAFLTTYPNKIHNNFMETYIYYTRKIDEMFSKNKYDIFTCSCGCYGLLLCDYVYKTYCITSVYIGNAMNTFFGISFNKSDYDMYYLKSDLNERYKCVDKIENNIYGYKS